ncbi:hypothetical protein HQ393_02875 [Chitinibacter bivalviorum]|uniref:Uncharacterized protein n=1 Tax=Chitinibacter bivalviorum TaxID=2739434 RepID=A0A7H9BGD8_9NEIS|nr:hypothetical protein [Chitinibacter bivalviorum]QLG87278.1 hypothetical protein HQ393_02875 [Chitinibacter bivalviorum]
MNGNKKATKAKRGNRPRLFIQAIKLLYRKIKKPKAVDVEQVSAPPPQPLSASATGIGHEALLGFVVQLILLLQ